MTLTEVGSSSLQRATGKVVHSMAQQTAKAAHSGHARAPGRQVFFWGRGQGPWEAAVPVRSSPSLAISTAQLTLCASCTSLLSRGKGSSAPAMPHPLSFLRMTALHFSQGQSYETKGEEYLSLMASDQCLAGGCLNLAVVFSLASVLKD